MVIYGLRLLSNIFDGYYYMVDGYWGCEYEITIFVKYVNLHNDSGDFGYHRIPFSGAYRVFTTPRKPNKK